MLALPKKVFVSLKLHCQTCFKSQSYLVFISPLSRNKFLVSLDLILRFMDNGLVLQMSRNQ